MRELKKAPIGVAILAVLSFIAAAYSVLQFFGALIFTSMALPWLTSTLLTRAGISLFFQVLAVSVVQAALFVALGIGLIKLQNWARVLLIVLIGLVALVRVVVISVAYGIAEGLAGGFIGTGVCVILLLYLFTSKVKQAFGATKF